jgi:ATP-dependent helicase/DNAse subunit B
VEKSFRFHFSPGFDNSKTDIAAGGRIDRIDLKDGITRIVDYKTGSVADHVGSIEDLFNEDREKDLDGWLQSLLYCEGYLHSNKVPAIVPSIYRAKKNPAEQFDNRLSIKQSRTESTVVSDYSSVRRKFLEGLNSIIKTILNPEEPFMMTGKRWNKCTYCPYKVLCKR